MNAELSSVCTFHRLGLWLSTGIALLMKTILINGSPHKGDL